MTTKIVEISLVGLQPPRLRSVSHDRSLGEGLPMSSASANARSDEVSSGLRILTTKGVSRPDVERLSEILRDSDPKIVLVFGSVARGEQTVTSDVDLLIVTQDGDSARVLRNTIREADLDVHPIVFSIGSLLNDDTVYPSFLAHLLEEGRALVGQQAWDDVKASLASRISDRTLLDAELRRRIRGLRLFDYPERFRRSPITACSHLYTIAKATVIVQLLRNDVHEFSWTRAFDRYAELRPDLAGDLDALKQLRPYYDASRHRPNTRIPGGKLGTDDIRRLAHSAAAIAE